MKATRVSVLLWLKAMILIHLPVKGQALEMIHICENENKTLSCSPGTYICFKFIGFGRVTAPGRCSYPPVSSDCFDRNNAGRLIRNQCENKQSCTIRAETSILGDPCPTATGRYVLSLHKCCPNGNRVCCPSNTTPETRSGRSGTYQTNESTTSVTLTPRQVGHPVSSTSMALSVTNEIFLETTVISSKSTSEATIIALSICAAIVAVITIGFIVRYRWYRKCLGSKEKERIKPTQVQQSIPVVPARSGKPKIYRGYVASSNALPGMKGYEIPMKSVNTTPEIDCYLQPMRPPRKNIFPS